MRNCRILPPRRGQPPDGPGNTQLYARASRLWGTLTGSTGGSSAPRGHHALARTPRPRCRTTIEEAVTASCTIRQPCSLWEREHGYWSMAASGVPAGSYWPLLLLLRIHLYGFGAWAPAGGGRGTCVLVWTLWGTNFSDTLRIQSVT